MPIETDQQYLERVVKEQTVQIQVLKNMVVQSQLKVDYLEEIYDHEEVTQ